MTNRFIPIFLILILLGSTDRAYSQGKSIYNKDFKAKVDKDVNEFYKNAPQFRTEDYMPMYLEKLSRVEITTKPIKKEDNYPLLSSLILMNKYNPELKRDNTQTFNPENFNPLKYNFNFFPKKEMIYRVDSTSYIIVISPQE